MLTIAKGHYALSKRTLPAPVSFIPEDCTSLDFESEKFDTVVDTFGLCSVKDPVKVLEELKRVTKPDGKILLLEHGMGTWDWLNSALNKTAHDHASKWGCWWNRDIKKFIDESGLQVEEFKRYHFGTTYWIVCKRKLE